MGDALFVITRAGGFAIYLALAYNIPMTNDTLTHTTLFVFSSVCFTIPS